jgi:subtilisin family serine protease
VRARDFDDLLRWLDGSKKRLVNSQEKAFVTGTAIVSLTAEEAVQLRSEVPGFFVSEDQPTAVFRPGEGARKKGPGPDDFWHLESIGLIAARKNGFTGKGKDVKVAVLDTGVNPDHPELKGKITSFALDPRTGNVQPMDPGRDTDGHGTLVAGLICGTNIGVAPEAEVVSLVMLPRGLGQISNFVHGLFWAAQQPDVRIVNISSGIEGYSSELEEPLRAVISAGILPVVATGDGHVEGLTYSPGNHESVLSVGASSRPGRIPRFSGGQAGLGRNSFTIPDLVAPGESILSTRRKGDFAYFSGTSLSAPIVSGVAALIVEKNPSISVIDLAMALMDSCKDLDGRDPDRQGKGLVQVVV